MDISEKQIFVVVSLIFQDRFFCVDQAVLKLRYPHASASLALGLKVCRHCPAEAACFKETENVMTVECFKVGMFHIVALMLI